MVVVIPRPRKVVNGVIALLRFSQFGLAAAELGVMAVIQDDIVTPKAPKDLPWEPIYTLIIAASTVLITLGLLLGQSIRQDRMLATSGQIMLDLTFLAAWIVTAVALGVQKDDLIAKAPKDDDNDTAKSLRNASIALAAATAFLFLLTTLTSLSLHRQDRSMASFSRQMRFHGPSNNDPDPDIKIEDVREARAYQLPSEDMFARRGIRVVGPPELLDGAVVQELPAHHGMSEKEGVKGGELVRDKGEIELGKGRGDDLEKVGEECEPILGRGSVEEEVSRRATVEDVAEDEEEDQEEKGIGSAH